MTDTIVKTVDLKAPIDKVWQAITDHREFGTWFQVDLQAPFEVGKVTRGVITHPECPGMVFTAVTTLLEPPVQSTAQSTARFAYRWPPDEFFIIEDPEQLDGTTLVEFELEEIDGGTRLTVTESGLEALADDLRNKVFEGNSAGWEEQMKNIRRHVAGGA